MGFVDDILRDAQALRPKKPEAPATLADRILNDAQSVPSRAPGRTLGESIVSAGVRPASVPTPAVPESSPPVSTMRDISPTIPKPTLTRTPIFGPEFTATDSEMQRLQKTYRVTRVKGPGIDPKSGLPLPGYDEYGWPIGPRTEAGTAKVPPQRILERREEPSASEILLQSAAHVIPSTIRRIGQAAQAAGEVVSRGEPGVPFRPPAASLAPALKAVGKIVEKAAGPEMEEGFVPERLKKDVLDDPSLLIDPKFYALHGPQVAGSMGTFLLAGWIGGPLLAASTEALMEAGSTYAAVRDATGDDQKAGDAAAESFVGNLAITYPEGLLFFAKGASRGLLKRLPDKAKALIETVESTRTGRAAVRGAAEAGQELTQEEIAYRTERPHVPERPPPQRGTTALLGGLAGGVAGAAIRPPRVSLEQQQKALSEARRASGISERVAPTIETPPIEMSETTRRIDVAQIREAEARAREAEAKAKIAEQQAEVVARPAPPPPSRVETGVREGLGETPTTPLKIEEAEPRGRRPPRAPETPRPTPISETRLKTEAEEEVEEGPGKPSSEPPERPTAEITPDMEAEHAGFQVRARDLRRRIREGQQGYRPPKKAKAEGETPASYLVSAGGANFHASGLGGETQDLPRSVFQKGLVTRKGGTSSDVMIDRMRSDHPEWGIQTESDLLELLRVGGDRLYNPTEAFEEEFGPATEEETLDLMGPKELQEELRKTQEQMKWYRDRGVTPRRPEPETEKGEEKPFDLFYDSNYNPRVGEDVLVGGQRRVVVESKGISPYIAGRSVDDTVTVYDPDTGKIEVIPRSTTRKIPTEPGPRATGPDLILERIHQRIRQEKLDPEVGDAGIAFVQSLQDTGYLDDLSISIRKGVKGGPQGRYQADVEATGERANAVVNLFHDTATSPRVLPHEIAHHLEQFVPEEDLAPLRDLYEREKAAHEKRKSTLSKLAQARRGEFTPEAGYRFEKNFSEYFAERVADLELLRQGQIKAEAGASVWIRPALKMKHLLQTWWDSVRAYFKGDVAPKIYRNLQLGRYGIIESGLGPAVGRYEAGAKPAEPFYSQLRRTIDEKIGGQQDVKSLKQMILKAPGVRQEEIEDTGLFDWLDQQAGKVKKADVLKFMDENTPTTKIIEHTEETKAPSWNVSGEDEHGQKNEWITDNGMWKIRRGKNAFLLQLKDLDEYQKERWSFVGLYDTLQDAKDGVPSQGLSPLKYPPNIYKDMWTPGGENHREVLLTLPPKAKADPYQSTHFDEPNVLAHVRMSDHVGPNAEKIILVDEMQSDWHLEGKKIGYKKTPEPVRLMPGYKLERLTNEEAKNLGGTTKEGDWVVVDPDGDSTDIPYPGTWDEQKVIERFSRDAIDAGLEGARLGLEGGPGIPDVPWKKTWHERAMKEVIRFAAENDYDRIAWTTGEQQVDRYNLSKYVDAINLVPHHEGGQPEGRTVFEVRVQNGAGVWDTIKDDVPLEKLQNYVTKDIAQRAAGGQRLFRGPDLKIGGEWAYALYDRSIPRFMSDYAKKMKWGSQPENISLLPVKYTIQKSRYEKHEGGGDWLVLEPDKTIKARFPTLAESEAYVASKSEGPIFHSIALTPEARDQVIYRGQPLYYNPKEEAPPEEPGTRERQLPKSLEAAGQFGGYERTYRVATDVEAQRIADDRLRDPDRSYITLTTKPAWDKPDMVTALSLAGYYGREGRRLTDEGTAAGDSPGTGKLSLAADAYNKQIALTHEASQKATTHGQATQALSMVSMLDPDGVLVYAQRRIDELNEGRPESKKQTLSPEETARLQAQATHAQVWESLGDRGREIAQLSDRVFTGQPLNKDEWKHLKDLFRAVQVSAPKRRSSKLPDLSKLGMAERARRAPTTTTPRPTTVPRPPSVSERVISRLDAAADAARQRRAERRGQIQALVDPSDIADAVIIGAAEFTKKGITFTQWSGNMLDEFGDGIRNHLQEIHSQSRVVYRQARDMELLANRALRKIQESEYDVDLPRPATKVQELARAYEALKAAPIGKTQDRAAQDVVSALKNLGKKDVSPLDTLMRQARKEAAEEAPRPKPETPPPDPRAKALARLLKRAETELEGTDPLNAQDALWLSTAVEKLKSTIESGRMEAAAEVAQAIALLEKPTLMGKVGSIYMTNMLSGTKTLLTRNPLGNEVLYRFGRIGRFALSPTIDRIVERVAKTGERTIVVGLNTQGFDWGALLRGDAKEAFTEDSYWTGLIVSARRSWKGLPAIVKQTEKFETGRVPQFRGKGWIQKGIEAATRKETETEINLPAIYTKTVTTVLDAFDNAGWVRARNATLGDMAKAAWYNAGKPENKKTFVENYLKNVPEEVLEWAESEANYYTLKDPTLLSSVLIGLKKLLNLEPAMIGMINKKAGEYLKSKGWKGAFGPGTIEFPFGQVPGSLIMKSIDYSPIGLLRGMYMLSKGVAKGRGMDAQFSQRETVKALTNGITGTTGFTLLAYWMASLGLIGGGDDEYRVGEFERQQTGQPARLWVNPDATARWVTSGFNLDEARRREGDTFFTFDWMSPAAVNLGMAVETYNNIREKGGVGALDISQIAGEALAAGAETMLSVPMLQTIRRTLRPTQDSESALKPLLDAIEGVPATLIAPSILNEVRQMVDNRGRVTTDPTLYQRVINRAVYRLPWLSKTLPIAYKTLGEEVPKEVYQNGRNTLFNVFLNPGFISTYRVDPMVEMLLRPYEEAGEKRQIPKPPKPKQEFSAHSINRVLFNGDKVFSDPVTIYLTKEDLSELQRITATLTTQKLGGVGTLSPDPDRAAQELSNLVNDAAQEARDWFIETHKEKFQEAVPSRPIGARPGILNLLASTTQRTRNVA